MKGRVPRSGDLGVYLKVVSESGEAYLPGCIGCAVKFFVVYFLSVENLKFIKVKIGIQIDILEKIMSDTACEHGSSSVRICNGKAVQLYPLAAHGNGTAYDIWNLGENGGNGHGVDVTVLTAQQIKALQLRNAELEEEILILKKPLQASRHTQTETKCRPDSFQSASHLHPFAGSLM